MKFFFHLFQLAKGEPPQQPICVLNIVLPDEIIPEAILPEHELHKYSYIQDPSESAVTILYSSTPTHPLQPFATYDLDRKQVFNKFPS